GGFQKLRRQRQHPLSPEGSTMSTYSFLANFAQTAGLLYFVGVFLGVVLYACWPRNKPRFDAAAHIPLRED
ncbi:cbb3-type cytochrome c oxidase subunit 3, partial [Klebsiella pneumoniae]|uniref:cbb3-type cytochrome c oxidase subunit 3 n=1 Tax=Klebsiella pneumoniae TaxID=573 RepID=UPI0019530636